MRNLFCCLLVVCLISISQAYHCYECNSTYNKNCFDFSPKISEYNLVDCDNIDATGQENCFSVQISYKKSRKMYRGCGRIGVCDKYETKQQDRHYIVLGCEECSSNNCNSSTSLIPSFLLVVLFAFYDEVLNYFAKYNSF